VKKKDQSDEISTSSPDGAPNTGFETGERKHVINGKSGEMEISLGKVELATAKLHDDELTTVEIPHSVKSTSSSPTADIQTPGDDDNNTPGKSNDNNTSSSENKNNSQRNDSELLFLYGDFDVEQCALDVGFSEEVGLGNLVTGIGIEQLSVYAREYAQRYVLCLLVTAGSHNI
jgi:hypothetical protein